MPIEQDPITMTETNDDGTKTDFEVTTAPAGEESLTDQIYEALFDDDASADDVTFVDTDGDGQVDAGAADTDGDGQIDTVAGDTDGDGRVDAVAVDTDGDGQLDVIAMDTDGDGVVDAVGEDTDGDGNIDVAMFDTDGDGEFDTTVSDTDGDGEFETVSTPDGVLPTDDELSTNSVEFNMGSDSFPSVDIPPGIIDEPPAFDPTPETPDYSVASPIDDTPSATAEPEADPSVADQQAHADAAQQAQAQADEFVDKGDYAAAADAREVAENEAWEAGDSSMLGSSDAGDLDNAAYKQEQAQDYRDQQADHIAAGDYEAAKEDAQNAAYATGDADYQAGGADHTGQSDKDVANLDWASWDQKNAEESRQDADWYAANDMPDSAASAADHAATYDAAAGDYADHADPTSVGYDYDPSSVVETGGGYDAGGYDAGVVDTGFDAGAGADAGVDMSSSYEPPIDDGTM